MQPQSRLLLPAIVCVAVASAFLVTVPGSSALPLSPSTVNVPSDGQAVVVALLQGTYILTPAGSYHYGSLANQSADASYYWGDAGNCAQSSDNTLRLLVDGTAPWVGACDTGHQYEGRYTCGLAICLMQLQIKDVYYPDNSGSIAVTIDPLRASQSVSVNSNGATVTANVGTGKYTIVAGGTYRYGSLSTQYADPSYYWGDAGDCAKSADGTLSLQMNGNSPWLGACSARHTYIAIGTCGSPSGCSLAFRVLDIYYPDNSGALGVRIDQH